MLTVTHEIIDNVDVISLTGILNADTSPKLEALLDPIAEKERPCILMQIPGLTYISSAGVGCFIGVIKKIRTKGGDIRFSNTDPRVKRVFALLDMDEFFKFFVDMEAGLASFHG